MPARTSVARLPRRLLARQCARARARSTTFVGSDTIAGNELARHSYLHNGLGQRVFKSEPQTEATVPNEQTLGGGFVSWLQSNFGWLWGAAQTNATLGDSYLYATEGSGIPSWALLGEYGNGGSNSSGRTEYLWLPQDAGAANNPAIPVGIYRGGQFYSLQTDHLGTPRLMKDNKNVAVWQWPYSAFGDNAPSGTLRTSTSPSSAIAVQSNGQNQTPTYWITSTASQKMNLRFAGQYFDSESGHYYNTYRTLMPGQGRYTQNDPIGLDGGWNRYGYVDANSLSLIDPLGLASCHYSISTGQLVCMPNGSERSTFQGSFASGNNSTPGCKNNWECQGVSNVGPLPEGVYEWTGRGRKSPDRRNLTPLFGTQYGRSAFQTHSCLNPFGASPSQKGACSNGCITGSPETVRRLNELLDREPRSILTVTP